MYNLLRPLNPGATELVPSDIITAASSNEDFASGGPAAYWRLFVRRRWTMILFAIAGIGAGLLAALLQPPLYEARSSLEVQDVNENFLNMKQVLPINENGLSGALSDLQTQIKILQSESVLKPVITRLLSLEAQLPRPATPVLSRVLGKWELVSPSSEFLQVETNRLADTLRVRALGQTRVIELTAESTSARLTADFLNQLCAEYIDQNMKARWEMSQRTSQSLARMLEEERVKLRETQDALQNYARQSGLMFTSEKKIVAEEKLSQLQDELSKAEASRIAAQARYDMAKRSWPIGLPDELSQGSVREYQSKLTELRRQRAELSTTYTSDYNKVKRLDAQIASLTAAIEEEQRDTIRRIESEYQGAVRREALLASNYARQSALVTDLAKRAIQYKILERDVDGNQQLYDRMLQQGKEATVASAIRASNVRVLDEAVPPKQPHSPKPVVNSVLGLLAGSFLGTLIAFTRERTDSSLREPGEGHKYLGLPELGAVLHNDYESEPLRTLESCRAVVTSILCTSTGTTQQLLAITSPGPREGKTTILVNLGVTLAAIGRRVLLVDADVRRPRLHEMFGMCNDRGLSTILEAGRALDEPLDNFVKGTSVAGLSVLPSGPAPGCTNRLHCPEFLQLLQRLREKHEFVLVDTPPVLQFADARVIGRLADGVVLVVRSGYTAREAAVAAYQRLVDDGTTVVGLILNDWDPEFSPYSYYATSVSKGTLLKT